jgi:hypothetical protein
VPGYLLGYCPLICNPLITIPRENISPDELILVVGTIKTNRWAIAVNVHESVESEMAFVVRGSGAKVWGEWSKSVGYEKCGPHAGK